MECHLEDDGTVLVAIEETSDDIEPQSLWVRVGPVFDGDTERDEPGIWIEYQEVHMKWPPSGPVLLTPAVWRQLAAAVEERLQQK